MGQVEGKIAIVTGAASGTGTACDDAGMPASSGARGCEGGGNGPGRCEMLEAYDTLRAHAPSPQHIIRGYDPPLIRSPRGRGRRLKGIGLPPRDAA